MVSFPDGADQALADAEFDRFISEQARQAQRRALPRLPWETGVFKDIFSMQMSTGILPEPETPGVPHLNPFVQAEPLKDVRKRFEPGQGFASVCKVHPCLI